MDGTVVGIADVILDGLFYFDFEREHDRTMAQPLSWKTVFTTADSLLRVAFRLTVAYTNMTEMQESWLHQA